PDETVPGGDGGVDGHPRPLPAVLAGGDQWQVGRLGGAAVAGADLERRACRGEGELGEPDPAGPAQVDEQPHPGLQAAEMGVVTVERGVPGGAAVAVDRERRLVVTLLTVPRRVEATHVRRRVPDEPR